MRCSTYPVCIHHGTTVSLFNRVRSQTVSTKYLGVSSNATTQRWHCPGTFDPTVASSDTAAACFVARTDGWDPFVIWLVEPDPAKREQQQQQSQSLQDQAIETDATPIGYPPPPGVAMHPRRHVSLSQPTHGGLNSFSDSSTRLIPVHYNQLVVLQCLTTGMVSPVMRVRKVEKGSIVTGGAEISEGTEVLGDPVSQLHKVAFEIYQPKHTQTSVDAQMAGNGPLMTPQSATMPQPFDNAPGTYLACLGDVVGVHPAVENSKRLISPPNTPTTTTATTTSAAVASPVVNPTPRSPGDLAADSSGSANPASSIPGSPRWTQSGYAANGSNAPASPSTHTHSLHEPVRGLKRRATQPSLAGGVHKSSPPVKTIRKVSSLGNFVVNSADAAAAAAAAGANVYPSNTYQQPRSPSLSVVSASGSAWNEDVGDASVWTIVGTECVRYTFYHPSSLEDPSFQFRSQIHLAPVTPVPCVHHVSISMSPDTITVPGTDGSRPQQTPLVSIYGENFTSDLSVWFGDRCSAQTEWRGRELITCYGPEPLLPSETNDSTPERHEVPLLLVRSDGVIFKTGRTLII
jgi:hypothetical protein